MKPVCLSKRVGHFIGKPVIHYGHTCSVWVSKPSHLDRGRPFRENHETMIARMAGEVYQDVNAVLSDLIDCRVIGHAVDV